MAQSVKGIFSFGWQDVTMDNITFTGSGCSYSATNRNGFGFGLRVNAASGAASCFTLGGSYAAAFWGSVRFKPTTPPATTARVILGTATTGLRWNADGTIGLYQGGTLRATSATALTDTKKWYLIQFKSTATVSIGDVLARINNDAGGVIDTLAAGAGTAFQPSLIWGANDTVADTYDGIFADAIIDEGDWPALDAACRLLVPTSDGSVGSGWQQPGGDTLDIFVAVVNTPPVGIADSTSSADANKMIRNPSANTAYAAVLFMPQYGFTTTDTFYAWQAMIATGAPVSTQAKVGSLGISSSGTIPAQTAQTFNNYHSGVNAGTYNTGWKVSRNTVLTNTNADGSNVTLTANITSGTTTRVAMICALGANVCYALKPPGDPVRNIDRAVLRATLF